MIRPGADDFRSTYRAGRPQLLWTETVADTDTPVSAMLKLARPATGAFLLESVEGGTVRGRYSLLGVDPDFAFVAKGEEAFAAADFAHRPNEWQKVDGTPLDVLRDLVAQCRMDVPDELPPAFATLVGHIGYESIGLVEPVMPAADPGIGLPDMMFVRPALLLVFDRLKDALFIAAPVYPGRDDADTAYARAVERIETAEAKLNGPLPAATSPTELPDGALSAIVPPEHYRQMVARAQDYILDGDIFQVVLAQRFSTDFELSAFTLYRSLRRLNPSPFLF
ncbi:MAG: chorismate-binding protein, partial [Pseudomonadota bacterium]